MQALIEQAGRPVLPTSLDVQPEHKEVIKEKEKESPIINKQPDEDTTDKKKPSPVTPRSPEQPPPASTTTTELKPPVAPSKPPTCNQRNTHHLCSSFLFCLF